jgi:aminopeptidase YwaD
MRPVLNTKRSVMVSLAFFALSCASSSHDEIAAKQAANVTLDDASKTDPVTHLNVIAAPGMEGRGTGAPGFHRAAEYIANECRSAGLVGAASAARALESSFFQPFTVGGFPVSPMASPDTQEEFGSDIFEDGLYVSGNASPDTIVEMNQKLCAAWVASGLVCPSGAAAGTTDPRPLVQAAAVATENIVAILPGTGPHRDEIVLLSAHLDHLGKTSAGTFFGADDNGSGSSTLLAIMHRLSNTRTERNSQTFDRTIAFLWTSGEEKGLLGAAYFVDNPPASVPLSQIKQVVNMDMVGAWDDTRFSVGLDNLPATTDAAALIDAANLEMDRPFVKIHRDVQSYARRQDGYAFSRRQIPALFVFEGLSRATGGGSLMTRYHKTTDTIEALMAETKGSKIRRIADILTIAVKKMANPPAPPSSTPSR